MSDNPIFAIAEQAAALRARGLDVVTLAAGEPQAATGPAVLAAAHAAVDDPSAHHYGPAQGEETLRARVAETLHTGTGLEWDASQVQVALGAKHALHLALTALVGPGDEVLVAAPGWPGHAGAVRAAGASPVGVPTVAGLEAIDGITCPLPDGGMFAFPDVSELLTVRGWQSTAQFARWLLHEAHVAVVPGEAFDAPGRLRVCVAVDDETLETALDRITRALSPVRIEEETR